MYAVMLGRATYRKIKELSGAVGRGILAISISAKQQRAQIWSRELRHGAESFKMPAHLGCLQVQPLLGKEGWQSMV